MGIIDTATKQLLPWRSTLWDDNLARVGGVTRIYGARHRARRLLLRRDQRLGWRRAADQRHRGRLPAQRSVAARTPTSSRCGSPGTSTASTRWPSPRRRSTSAVTSSFIESPDVRRPLARSRQRRLRHRPGPGRLRPRRPGRPPRPHRRVSTRPPARRSSGTHRRLELVRGQQGHGGHPARPVHRRRRHVPGRRPHRPGRVLRLQHGAVPGAAARHHDHRPRSRAGSSPTTRRSRSPAPRGSPPARVGRVQVQIQDRDSSQYLPGRRHHVDQHRPPTLNATLGAGHDQPDLVAARPHDHHQPQHAGLGPGVHRRDRRHGRLDQGDQEVRVVQHRRPDARRPAITGPSGIQTSTTFTVTGTANDDKGVNSLTLLVPRRAAAATCRTTAPSTTSSTRFRGTPDVIGATNATWSYEVTLPHEGVWRGSATATDTIGQADLRSATRDWTVDSNAVAPTVTIEPAGRR